MEVEVDARDRRDPGAARVACAHDCGLDDQSRRACGRRSRATSSRRCRRTLHEEVDVRPRARDERRLGELSDPDASREVPRDRRSTWSTAATSRRSARARRRRRRCRRRSRTPCSTRPACGCAPCRSRPSASRRPSPRTGLNLVVIRGRCEAANPDPRNTDRAVLSIGVNSPLVRSSPGHGYPRCPHSSIDDGLRCTLRHRFANSGQ